MSIETEQRNKLVLDNEKLVYFTLKKLGIGHNFPEYEDLVSEGMLGLIKASRSFEFDKNVKFSTYAVKCISNQISVYLAKMQNCISLDSPAYKGDNDLTLKDVLIDPKSDFIKESIFKQELQYCLDLILNELQGIERIVLLYRLGDWSLKKISIVLNINEASLRRKEREGLRKIRILKREKILNKKIEFKIFEKFYQISFQVRDPMDAFVRKLLEIAKEYKFIFTISNTKLIIKLPPNNDAYLLLGRIFSKLN